MEASLLLFVFIQVYVERERDSSRLRARSLTDFCYDTHIPIMPSMLAAVRDLTHWEPVSVKFVSHTNVDYVKQLTREHS